MRGRLDYIEVFIKVMLALAMFALLCACKVR